MVEFSANRKRPPSRPATIQFDGREGISTEDIAATATTPRTDAETQAELLARALREIHELDGMSLDEGFIIARDALHAYRKWKDAK